MIGTINTDQEAKIPSDNINPELKKQAKYCLAWAKAAYYLHRKDEGAVLFSSIKDIALKRLHAEGCQPIDQYLDLVCPKNKKTGMRSNYMDISLDILTVIPKFRSVVIGKFLQMDHDITADAIDEKSGAERQNMRFKVWAKAETQKALKPIQDMLEIDPNQDSVGEIMPQSIEELDMLQSIGAFKLKWEAGMEKLLEDMFYSSSWPLTKTRIYEDLFDLGFCCARDYTDKLTGKAKARYVDPARWVGRYSKEHLYTKIDHAGEIIDLTPNQIRVDAGEDIPSEELESIIKNYSKNNNELSLVANGTDTVSDFYNDYGNLDVQVLDLTWKTIDVEKQERKTDANGHHRYYNKPYEYQDKGSENRKVLIGKKQMVYKCKWIIGTNYVYDYGVEEDILRPNPKEVTLPFHFYRLTNKSMLTSIMPLGNNFQLAWMKFQNCLAKAAPSGIAVDVGALKNITNGVNKLPPLQLLAIRRQTGDLLFKSTTHHSQVINPNAGRPIIDLPGGAGQELDEHMKVMEYNVSLIGQITGINPLMDATAPAPNTLVGTAQIAEQGTNNVLYNLYFAYKTVKESVASNGSLRIQNIIRYVDYKPYEPIVGTAMVNIFKQGSPIAHASYGIKLELRATGQDKKDFLDKAALAFQEKTIRLSDYMYLEQEVKSGSIKYARMYLMYKEDLYEKQRQAESQANVEAQSKAIQDQQQTGTQLNMAEEDNMSKNRINEMSVRKELDTGEYFAKHNMKKDQDNNQSENKIKENILK